MPFCDLDILVYDKTNYHADALKSELESSGISCEIEITNTPTDLLKNLNQTRSRLIVLFDLDESLSIPDITASLASQESALLYVVTEYYNRTKALQLIRHGVQNVFSQDELNALAQDIKHLLPYLKKSSLVIEQRENIKQATHRFQTLFNYISTPVCYAHQGGLTSINPSFARFFQIRDLTQAAEISILDLIADEDQKKVRQLLNQMEKSKVMKHAVLKNISVLNSRHKSQAVELLLNKSTINGENVIQLVMNPCDLKNDTPVVIKGHTQTQGLTPEYFIQKLNQVIRHPQPDKVSALCLMEIDNYHKIKKNQGIARAERVMQQAHDFIVAKNSDSLLISQASTDVFYLLATAQDKAGCLQVIKQLQQSFQEMQFNVEEHSVKLPLNIGLVHLQANIDSPEQAFSLADVACTVARNRQSGEIHVFNPEQDRSTVEAVDQNWDTSIQQALKNDDFKLVFQPIISLKSPGQANYEVLLRMKSSSGNDILPSQFLHAAKQSQLEVDIDCWVISHALNTLKATNQTETMIFVKISEGSLKSMDFFNWLKSLNTKDKKQMVIELTEELAIRWPSDTLNLLQERQHSGYRVCIEQFGNHPETTEELFELKADFYKIDGAFSNHLATNRKHQSIIHKISLSTKGRNIQTIACFVQDADSLAILWQEGFDYIQGNYLQAPQPRLDYEFGSLL